MIKHIVLFVLLLVAGTANAAIKNCNVGADSWWVGMGNKDPRPIPEGSTVWVLSGPLEVDSLNGKGNPSGRCLLLAGEALIIPVGFDTSIHHRFASLKDKMGLAWIRRCGNPIVSMFRLTPPVSEAPAKPVSLSVPVVLPPQKPIPRALVRESTLPTAVVEESSSQKEVESPLSNVGDYFGETQSTPTRQEESSSTRTITTTMVTSGSDEGTYVRPGLWFRILSSLERNFTEVPTRGTYVPIPDAFNSRPQPAYVDTPTKKTYVPIPEAFGPRPAPADPAPTTPTGGGPANGGAQGSVNPAG